MEIIRGEEEQSNGGEKVGPGSARTHAGAPSLSSLVNLATDPSQLLCASGCPRLKQRQGSPFAGMEEFCMFIVMVVIQLYTCDKMLQDRMHAHTKKNTYKNW